MKRKTTGICHWISLLGILALNLVWITSAMAVDITIGGGPTLDLSTYHVLSRESFEPGQSAENTFLGKLDVGSKAGDPWTGMMAKGAYALTHTGQTGSVRYYFRAQLDQGGHALTEFPISVEVSGNMTGQLSAAGLLYGYNPRNKHYLAFVVGNQGAYTIYKRDAEGLNRYTSGTSKAVRTDQPNQLAIVPNRSKVDFYINGTHVTAIRDETITGGGGGILAISSGMFLFDNFTVYQSSGQHASPVIQQDERQQPAMAPASQTQARIDDREGKAMPRKQKPAPAPQGQAPAPQVQKQPLRNYKELLKSGMTKQEVVQVLGPPAYMRGPAMFYDLDGGEARTLVIQIDQDGNVLKYKAIK